MEPAPSTAPVIVIADWRARRIAHRLSSLITAIDHALLQAMVGSGPGDVIRVLEDIDDAISELRSIGPGIADAGLRRAARKLVDRHAVWLTAKLGSAAERMAGEACFSSAERFVLIARSRESRTERPL